MCRLPYPGEYTLALEFPGDNLVMASLAPNPLSEACEERKRLQSAYNVALIDHSRSVQVLIRRAGVLSKEQYGSIRKFCETARGKANTARRELEQHTAEHGCS